MEIRIASEEDAKGIADIIKRHSQDDYMGYATFDESYVKKKMNRDFFIVAIEKARIIGCVRLSIAELDLAEIRTLCVDEDQRRQGLASKLLDEALILLKQKGMRKVVARTKAGNAAALSFFRKFNFEQEGYFKEHYRKGIDVVQLARFI